MTPKKKTIKDLGYFSETEIFSFPTVCQRKVFMTDVKKLKPDVEMATSRDITNKNGQFLVALKLSDTR